MNFSSSYISLGLYCGDDDKQWSEIKKRLNSNYKQYIFYSDNFCSLAVVEIVEILVVPIKVCLIFYWKKTLSVSMQNSEKTMKKKKKKEFCFCSLLFFDYNSHLIAIFKNKWICILRTAKNFEANEVWIDCNSGVEQQQLKYASKKQNRRFIDWPLKWDGIIIIYAS